MKDLISRMSEAASKATPGEWLACDYGDIRTEDDEPVLEGDMREVLDNAAFIALANPANVLKLLEAHKVMREALEWMSQNRALTIFIEESEHVAHFFGRNDKALTRVSEILSGGGE